MSTVEQVAQNDAVMLFVERARTVHPAFALTDRNAPAVAALCRKLDGLPLAIELAAARSTVLSPEALVDALTDHPRLPGGGPRDLPPRQQTIETTIAWSYALLDDATRVLFRRLAVFLGGFTLEAAQAVSREDQSADDVVAGLTALVEQNLVRRIDTEGEPRFTLLETIRAFGLERLEEAGERAAAQDAHARYFIEWSEGSSRYQPQAMVKSEAARNRTKPERANIRAALTHLIATGHGDGVLRLAGAVGWFVQINPREGRTWLEWALAHTAESATVPRGIALAELAGELWAQGDYERARHLGEASHAIADQLNNPEIAAQAIDMLGSIALSQHDYTRSRLLLERAVDSFRQLGERSREAEALQLLAGAEHGLGDDEAAVRHAMESLTLHREIGHEVGAAGGLCRLGRLTRDQGNDRAAALAYHEALDIGEDAGERWFRILAFAGLAELASRRGQADIAAALIGAIDAFAQESGATRLPVAGVNYDRAIEAARTALGAERFAEVREAGRMLRIDDAIPLARGVSIPVAVNDEPDPPWSLLTTGDRGAGDPHAPPIAEVNHSDVLAIIRGRSPVPAATFHLTNREQEVLALLGERRTDLEIAAQLFISRKTASTHVSSILAKLGATNRRDAAAIAARQGLL